MYRLGQRVLPWIVGIPYVCKLLVVKLLNATFVLPALICLSKDETILPYKRFLVSEVMPIQSEYMRLFLIRQTLTVDLKYFLWIRQRAVASCDWRLQNSVL